MRAPLQAWYDQWLKAHEETDLIYVGKRDGNRSYLGQLEFVRDTLGPLLWADKKYEERPNEPPPRSECKESAWVIGEHRSKSVPLPVYSLERPDLGLQFVLRDNYYNWNVSVISEKPVTSDLRGFQLDFSDDDKGRDKHRTFSPGDYWGYCFFEGFPDALRFGPHSLDPRKFSLTIGSDHRIYTFLFLILRDYHRPKEA